MRNIAIFAAIVLLPLTLAACGSNTNAADEEAKVKEAVAFLSTADGTPGIFVKGRDIVLSYASRPPTFADSAR